MSLTKAKQKTIFGCFLGVRYLLSLFEKEKSVNKVLFRLKLTKYSVLNKDNLYGDALNKAIEDKLSEINNTYKEYNTNGYMNETGLKNIMVSAPWRGLLHPTYTEHNFEIILP